MQSAIRNPADLWIHPIKLAAISSAVAIFYLLFASSSLHSQEFTVEITIPSLSRAWDRANPELILLRQQSLKCQHLSTLPPPPELPWRKQNL